MCSLRCFKSINRCASLLLMRPVRQSTTRTLCQNLKVFPKNSNHIKRRVQTFSALCSGQNLRRFSSVANREAVDSKEETQTQNSQDIVKVIFIDRDGERQVIDGKVGDNVMYLAQRHDLDVEGACEASLACCTCHVYVEDKFYEMMDEPCEEEEDMLDLAPFLKENSRLSCQIILSKEMDGMEITLPSATRNFYVDGHKPKPHWRLDICVLHDLFLDCSNSGNCCGKNFQFLVLGTTKRISFKVRYFLFIKNKILELMINIPSISYPWKEWMRPGKWISTSSLWWNSQCVNSVFLCQNSISNKMKSPMF